MAAGLHLQSLLSEYLPRDEGWIGHGRLLRDIRSAVEDELEHVCSEEELRDYIDRTLVTADEILAAGM